MSLNQVRELLYSPICDVDCVAYLAYLKVIADHGERIEQFVRLNGAGRCARCDCLGDYARGDVVGHVYCSTAAQDVTSVAGDGDIDVSVDKSGVIGGGASRARADSDGVAGLASSDACEGGGEFCRGVCDDAATSGGAHSQVGGGSLEVNGIKVVDDADAGVLDEKELKRLRNRRARKLRKERRRAGRVPISPAPTMKREGFFSACDDEVQRELRETRARLLIARNKRQEVEEERKAVFAKSVAGEARHLLEAARVSQRLSNMSKQAGIAVWAQVADRVASSVSSAASVPASVPSLDEIGYGDSALSSASEGPRMEEYRAKRAQLDDYYDSCDGYGVVERDEQYARLRAEYSDVSFTVAEGARFKAFDDLTEALCALGVDYNVVEIARRSIDVV